MPAPKACYTTSDLPIGFEEVIDPNSAKPYYRDHDTKTTSWQHPRHIILHEPYTPGLPYPYERKMDEKGRAYYVNHETKTTSWMHPVQVERLKTSGILDRESDPYGGEDGQAWKGWILGAIAGKGDYEGMEYWVDYHDGTVNWRSPEDIRVGAEAVRKKKAALEARSSGKL